MNNPMSLMADAAKLSITQLQQAIKNGTVPPYIGVPLLQQKVKESQQAKQAMAVQQPAQPPVAQAVMQQAQGVDALPTNLPAQGMAGGGIISFAEGGGYGSDDYDPTAMAQDYRTKANEQYQGYLGSRPEYGIGSILANRAQTNAAAELQANTRTPYDDAVKYYKSIGDNAGFATAQAKRSEWLKNPTNLMENAAKAGQPQVAPQASPTAVTPQVKARADVAAPAPDRTRADAAPQVQRRAPSGDAGISGLGYTPEKYDTSYIDELKKGDLNEATGKPYTKAELAAERKAEFIAAGGDPDIYKTQKEAAEKAGTKSEARRRADEAAPWFAASKKFGEAKANEGILGLTGKAIAEAGTEAGAITKEDDLRAEATRKELGQIALAQNAYSQAQAVGDREAMQKAKDTIERHTTLLGAVKAKDTDAINESLKTKAQEATQIKVAGIGAAASKYAADKADRSLQKQADDIMADAKDAGVKITKSEAYKQAQENAMPSYGAADARTQAGYQKQIDTLLGKRLLAPTPKDKADIDNRIAYYKSLLTATPAGGAPAGGNVVDFSKLPTAK
jgi:hypothetical protein